MRGMLLNQSGEILAKSQHSYYLTSSDGTKYEQSPKEFSDFLHVIVREIVQQTKVKNLSIDAISLTSQRSSVMAVDKNIKPLTDFIMWHDKRCSSICAEKLENFGDKIYSFCATRLTPVMSAPKMTFIKRSFPEIYEGAYKLIGIHDYLLYLLTDKLVTDSSTASRTCLLNIVTKQWSDELCKIFEVDRSKLCDIVSPGTIVGGVSQAFCSVTGLNSGIPVISAGGDQQCSVLGQGLSDDGEVGITIGTGSYLAMVSNTPVFDPQKSINLNVAASADQWVLEASTMASGLVYRWFSEGFYPQENQRYPFERIDKEISLAKAGANGVIALPSLSGTGCPVWDPYAKGAFLNISYSTDRAVFARALLEGISAEISQCYEVLSLLNGTKKHVILCGGLSKFDIFNQTIADMLNIEVTKAYTAETTVVGAAVSCLISLGVYSSAAEAFKIIKNNKPEKIFYPSHENYIMFSKINKVRALIIDSIPTKTINDILCSTD